MSFDFKTDERSVVFCEWIVKAIELLFDLDGASGRDVLNDAWRGVDFIGDDLRYHETELYWAMEIGNPNPYREGFAQDQWRARQDEAGRRIEELRGRGEHGWLWSHLASWDEYLGLPD